MFDRKDIIITEDNIRASKQRADAIRAIKERRATPEQVRLVKDLDAAIDRAFQQERR